MYLLSIGTDVGHLPQNVNEHPCVTCCDYGMHPGCRESNKRPSAPRVVAIFQLKIEGRRARASGRAWNQLPFGPAGGFNSLPLFRDEPSRPKCAQCSLRAFTALKIRLLLRGPGSGKCTRHNSRRTKIRPPHTSGVRVSSTDPPLSTRGRGGVSSCHTGT